jgi:hypothetical protein
MSDLPNSYDPHENSYAPYSLIVENFGNVKIGGSCNSNNDCSDENCIGGLCQKVCNKGLKSSDCDCNQHNECKSNNCVNKICSSTDCNGNKKAATCSCQSNNDCLNNKCDNNKCARLLSSGSMCFKNNDCVSNKCSKNKCN